jgi:septum site-determining protein MinC
MGREEAKRTLYIRRTLRSGQRVRYDGSVVVMGDVNPGAEVLAAGDVIVLGAMRGMAHAGCQGDGTCCVMALRLEPTQIRIGKTISRPPEGRGEGPQAPERARVVDGQVVIERWLQRGVGGTRVV